MYHLIRYIFKRKDSVYDGRALKEPAERVQKLVDWISGVSFAAVVLSFSLDHVFSWSRRCGDPACNWFGRSGALMVIGGTYLAFMSGAVIIKKIKDPCSDSEMSRPNPDASRDYGRPAFVLLAVGTLIWAYGDLLQ